MVRGSPPLPDSISSEESRQVEEPMNTLTVAEAARLLGRTTEAVRKLIERHDIEKVRDANGYTYRVRTVDIVRAAKRTEQ